MLSLILSLPQKGCFLRIMEKGDPINGVPDGQGTREAGACLAKKVLKRGKNHSMLYVSQRVLCRESV